MGMTCAAAASSRLSGSAHMQGRTRLSVDTTLPLPKISFFCIIAPERGTMSVVRHRERAAAESVHVDVARPGIISAERRTARHR